MPHFRVDDGLEGHPKAQRSGDEALGMWVRAGSWCMRYLTDGFVPGWWVKQQPKGAAKARRLVEAGFWHPAERDGEKGWQFHDFIGPGRQDSRAQIEAEREKWRKKKAGQRATSPGDKAGDTSPTSPGDTSGDSPEDSPYARATRPRTNPTQPNPKEDLSGYLPESATDSNGHSGIAATPGAELVNELIPQTHPDAVRSMLRVRASELLREGHPRADVATALELWLTKPSLGPNALASVLSEVLKARAAPNGSSKLRDWATLAREVRAAENGTPTTKAIDQ
jgi:hypothetical protein